MPRVSSTISDSESKLIRSNSDHPEPPATNFWSIFFSFVAFAMTVGAMMLGITLDWKAEPRSAVESGSTFT